MKKRPKIKQFFETSKEYRWYILFTVVGICLLSFLLWFRLGSLTGGKAAAIELQTKAAAASWQAIILNPLNAPYKILQKIVIASGHSGITSLRLISTFFGLAAVCLFYFVARQWHSMRVALLASWLFISSAWFLHIARLGSPDILLLTAILAVIVVLSPNRRGRQSALALPSTLLILSVVLYVPGMVWLVLAGGIVQRKNIVEAWKASPQNLIRIVSVGASAVLVIPLIYALVKTPYLLKDWIGYQIAGPVGTHILVSMFHNVANAASSFVYQSSFNASYWLGNQPLLSSFEIAMALLGSYFYACHLRAARTRLIIILSAVAWFVIGVDGVMNITILVPFAYLLVAAGIAYILQVWLKTFPNNPVGRNFGITVVMVAVMLTSIYQTRSYFVAWTYNSETIKTFDTKL